MTRRQGDGMGFLNSEKMIVGYDLGDEYSQISFSASAKGEAETLSQVAGAQMFNIPTVLCRRYGTNQWFYGREAVRNAESGQGVLVGNLLTLAMDGEPVLVDGESFDPVALLALFFRRSLGLLPKPLDKVMALMITCHMVDRRILEMLSVMLEGVGLKTDKLAFQSHAESYYSYMVRQGGDLMNFQSLLFDSRRDCIRVYRMELNRHTTPMVVLIGQEEYAPEAAGADQGNLEERDAAFCRIAQRVCGEAVIGSVYLIGDYFAEEWMKNSLRFLCRSGRRVFLGNNLFSKGACYGMQERLERSIAGSGYVFLGSDKLKANIGMRVFRSGKDSYYALLDAGTSWYEAEKETEVYIQDGNELELVITPLIRAGAKGVRRSRLVLDGLPGGVARVRLRFYVEEEDSLVVEAQDLGFGEFRPSCGRMWKETIAIYAGEKE